MIQKKIICHGWMNFTNFSGHNIAAAQRQTTAHIARFISTAVCQSWRMVWLHPLSFCYRVEKRLFCCKKNQVGLITWSKSSSRLAVVSMRCRLAAHWLLLLFFCCERSSLTDSTREVCSVIVNIDVECGHWKVYIYTLHHASHTTSSL